MSMIGKSLAHYSITAPIGKGGMGEVYQATDTKLGRAVAIKVLPGEFSRDTDRIARFQREAKLLASLNHPNIAAIHGLEEADGIHFLVLELVEGQTLAGRIRGGPVPVEEALKLALQIAEALEAAHEKGIIHRDLKPANIKVTPEGKVKVLDFGLAKAYAGDPENMNLSNSPTLSDMATQQGVILGTAAYMPPEQAKGKTVDKRADIWAFGVVLFEMLTGRQSFTGETVSETLASVIKSEPEWQSLPPNLHPRIRLLLERCLKKEPQNRYSGISDARVDIQAVLSDPRGCEFQQAAAEQRKRSHPALLWIAAIILVGAIVGAAVWYLRTPEPPQVMRFDYDLPQGQQFTRTDLPVMAVSPDGKQFVYATPEGLYLRSTVELTAKLIAGTEGQAGNPFFSPDGKSIAYYSLSDRKLKKIAVTGGAPVALCDFKAMAFVGGHWNVDNTIIFGQAPGPIMRVSANGGTPEAITENAAAHVFPQILPGGKYLMYTALPNPRIVVQSLKSGEIKELFAGGDARYLPTGHIVHRLWENNDNLFAVPFDLDRLEATGGAVPVVEGILQYAVSDAGTLVCIPGTARTSSSGALTLVWVNRDGKEEPLGAPLDQYLFPRISPDGKLATFTIAGDNADIWVRDLVRGTMTRLTFDKGNDYQPIWTPDSRQVLFWSEREGSFGAIFRKNADGTGAIEKLVADPNRQLYPWDLSHDGKNMVVMETPDPYTQADLSMMSMEGNYERKLLLQQEEYVETQAKLSPDGKWMAYVSNESGQSEIYVRSFPDMERGRWQLSISGGVSPLWAPNGRELFYFSEDDASVMAVAVETDTVFRAGTPKKLFSRSPYSGGGATPGTPWDIHPDGKRFLMMKLPGAQGDGDTAAVPGTINVFLNWLEELKQRAPAE